MLKKAGEAIESDTELEEYFDTVVSVLCNGKPPHNCSCDFEEVIPVTLDGLKNSSCFPTGNGFLIKDLAINISVLF